MKIEFTGNSAQLLDAVSFQASVDGANVSCRVTIEALQDIDPPNRMDDPLSQFASNKSSIQHVAEKLIRSGRVINGQLDITNADLLA